MGFWEIILIVIVALFVLGPKRLPEFALWCGKVWRQAKSFMDGAKDEVDKQMKLIELEKNIKRAKAAEEKKNEP
jgi:Tat protein translocase TatB subunit